MLGFLGTWNSPGSQKLCPGIWRGLGPMLSGHRLPGWLPFSRIEGITWSFVKICLVKVMNG